MPKTPTDIRSLARKHTALALRVLKEVVGSPKAQTSARVAAAVALLDRGWGKPKQEMEISGDALGDFYRAIAGTSRAHQDDDSPIDRTTH